MPVQLDFKPLADAGIKADAPVTFASSQVSAKATIALMLRELGLTSVIRDEVLLITTPEEADNLEETRVYEVSDPVSVRRRRRLRLSDRLDHELCSPNELGVG